MKLLQSYTVKFYTIERMTNLDNLITPENSEAIVEAVNSGIPVPPVYMVQSRTGELSPVGRGSAWLAAMHYAAKTVEVENAAVTYYIIKPDMDWVGIVRAAETY